MITLETTINYKGKKMTVDELAKKFGCVDEDRKIKTVNVLIAKKLAFIPTATTEEEELLEDLINEDEILRRAEAIEKEEDDSTRAYREEELKDVDNLNIRLAFITSLEALSFEDKLLDLGIEETSIINKKGAISLVVENITPAEYSKITRMYSLEKGVRTTVNAVSKGAGTVTDTINYGATNLVAPVIKITGEVGMNLAKGLFQTITKAGAGFVNAGGKAIRDTKVELGNDSELIKARAELRAGANGVKNTVREKMNKRRRSSGVETF